MLKCSLIRIRLVVITALITAVLMPWTHEVYAFEKINTTFFGVAIKGYDTVAYHTEGRAVKGNSKFSYTWNDAKWYFASSDNKDLFAEDPERYSPQYGGHWARSLSTTGKVAGVNPKAFKIIEGKLYLNFNSEASAKFEAEADENIKKADENWNELTKK